MRKTIASIYPLEQTAERPLYQGFYHLPAVKKGEPPFLLPVNDKVQIERELYIAGHGEKRTSVPGEEIAPDILREWTTGAPGMSPFCGPGIWMVRDEVVEDGARRAATEQEKARMFAEDHEAAKQRQAAWLEYQIVEGDRLGDDPKTRKAVTPLMKLSARYMGRERKWLEEMRDSDVRACPFCTKHIPAGAIKCPECGEIVDFEAYARLQAKKQSAIDAAARGVVQPPVAKPGQPARA